LHYFFRDIARGGIRIIKSANKTTYDQNSASLFEENYNLAYTQQQKNKGKTRKRNREEGR
jgi:glutamate dehydrogenase